MKKLLFILLLIPLMVFGQKETIIHITTDNYPQETRWVLYADSMYGSILGSVQYGYYTQPNTPHMDTLYIPDSLTNITFVIYDSWGDGGTTVTVTGDAYTQAPLGTQARNLFPGVPPNLQIGSSTVDNQILDTATVSLAEYDGTNNNMYVDGVLKNSVE